MVNQQLLDYIKQQQSQGVSKEVISANLLSQGRQQQDINEAFSAAENQKSVIQQAPQISSTPKKQKRYWLIWGIILSSSHFLIAIIPGGLMGLITINYPGSTYLFASAFGGMEYFMPALMLTTAFAFLLGALAGLIYSKITNKVVSSFIIIIIFASLFYLQSNVNDKTFNPYKNLTISDCDKLDELGLNKKKSPYERDFCIEDVAGRGKDYEPCYKLRDFMRQYYCIRQVGYNLTGKYNCDVITDQSHKYFCIGREANRGDKSSDIICATLSNDNNQRDYCYYGFAHVAIGAESCGKIDNEKIQEQCCSNIYNTGQACRVFYNQK